MLCRESSPKEPILNILKGSIKTFKILSGNRFHREVFSIDTHQFFGTGCGIYSIKDGKY